LWVWFHFWQVFVFRVLYFCSEHFLTILMGNNNKMTENDVPMVWVLKLVIMCWFVTFRCFHAKWFKLLGVIFLSRIDGKQQLNDQKLCIKDLGEKGSLSWVGFHFWQDFVFRVLYFCFEHFLTILMGNNNKMTKNDVRIVWVQKQVIKCWFVTFASFCAKWPKLLTVIFLSRIEGKEQQNDQKLCGKDFSEKCTYLMLVSIFGRFSCLQSCTFVLNIF